MLVISCKIDGGVDLMNGLIQVKVVQIKGKSIRLGIEAPKEIPINRLGPGCAAAIARSKARAEEKDL